MSRAIVLIMFLGGLPLDAQVPGPPGSDTEVDRRIKALEAAAASVPKPGPPSTEVGKTLAEALQDPSYPVRMKAAELLGRNQDPNVAVPALVEALQGMEEPVAWIMERLYPKRDKRGRPVDEKGKPRRTSNTMTYAESKTYMSGVPYAVALIDALGHYAVDSAFAALRDFVKRSKVSKTPGALLVGAGRSFARFGTKPSLDEAVSLLKRVEKFLSLPKERRPKAKTTAHNSLTNIVHARARLITEDDRQALHDALVESFERSELKGAPKFHKRKRMASSWKSAINRNRKNLPPAFPPTGESR